MRIFPISVLGGGFLQIPIHCGDLGLLSDFEQIAPHIDTSG